MVSKTLIKVCHFWDSRIPEEIRKPVLQRRISLGLTYKS